jgi:tRNA dimethylallyltransferase
MNKISNWDTDPVRVSIPSGTKHKQHCIQTLLLMSQIKPKIISIVGPTASGKSDLAVILAKELGGEIISTDSRQVYKGLDIGSGKITKKEMMGVPHHLLDVCNPKKTFTVTEFKKLAEERILDILKRGKVPILCGGTGFYIDAVVKNLVFPEVPPDAEFRIKAQKSKIETLQKQLLKLDPIRYETIDLKNKVRLIRAIEIAKAIGKVPQIKTNPNFDTLTIGTLLVPEVIKERIENRLTKRMKQGMVKEVKDLHNKNKVSWKRLESLGLEYRYVAMFLQDKITKTEMLELIKNESWHYAKRQMTWFQRDKSIKWIEPNKVKEIEKVVRGFLG